LVKKKNVQRSSSHLLSHSKISSAEAWTQGFAETFLRRLWACIAWPRMSTSRPPSCISGRN
jgi:hypothetical protein